MEYLDRLAASLPAINGNAPHHFLNNNGLAISGEYGDCLMDYYGEFNNGQAWIHSDLMAWAEKMGGFFEWLNPGAIVFIQN